MGLLAVIRIRGTVNMNSKEETALKILRLHKRNHAVLITDTPQMIGILKTAWKYITWGEIDKTTLQLLLIKRGRKIGNKPLTENDIKNLGFNGFEDLAQALLEGKVKLKDLKMIKPVFRLHPPRKGFKKSVKKMYTDGGELGYRGPKINELLLRMI
ncbi:MAG: 50S ribosomal protein L30 [Thermoprotei archaeon]|jgi:large subunit ribosomal protein L30